MKTTDDAGTATEAKLLLRVYYSSIGVTGKYTDSILASFKATPTIKVENLFSHLGRDEKQFDFDPILDDLLVEDILLHWPENIQALCMIDPPSRTLQML